jgi:hypothetical protein
MQGRHQRGQQRSPVLRGTAHEGWLRTAPSPLHRAWLVITCLSPTSHLIATPPAKMCTRDPVRAADFLSRLPSCSGYFHVSHRGHPSECTLIVVQWRAAYSFFAIEAYNNMDPTKMGVARCTAMSVQKWGRSDLHGDEGLLQCRESVQRVRGCAARREAWG